MYVTPGLYLSDLAAGSLLVLGLLRIENEWSLAQIREYFRAQKIAIPLFILPVLALATAPWALAPQLALYTALRWLLAAGVFVVWQTQCPRPQKYLPVFLIGLGVQAGVGLLQFIFRSPLGLPGELALRLDQTGAAAIWVSGVGWLRAYGLTFHPNVLGGFLAAGLVLGLPLVEKAAFRWLWWGLAAGLVLTFSRSAWIAAAVMVPLCAAWMWVRLPRSRQALAVTLGGVAGAALIGAILLAEPILTRLNVFGSYSEYISLSGRGELLNLSIRTIAQHPLTGIGAGNFPLAALNAQVHDFAHYVHHVALMLAAEVSPLGAGLWYWLWLAPAFSVVKRFRSANPWPVVTAAAWFGLGLVGLWDSYPWSLEAGRLLSVTLLAWYSQSSQMESSHEKL